jgi:DNA polymerase-1
MGGNDLFSAIELAISNACFRQHTAYLAASNVLGPHDPEQKRKKERKRLSDACRAYGIPGWENIDKEQMQKDIGAGRWQIYGREGVFSYCEEDVKQSTELLRKQLRPLFDTCGRLLLPAADVERVIWWSEYSAKAVAQIQSTGMPVDTELWQTVQENKAAVIGELLTQLDPSHNTECPIYTPEGHFSYERFERWLATTGVLAWPRLQSGKLDTSGDAYRLMYHTPGIEALHALKDSIGFITKATLPIGRDGRNRPSLFPFGTATGRNAHAKSLYNVHAGMRSFMVFPSDVTGVYLDWRTQEIGVAAARSNDQKLKEAYLGGDIYHALALLCGFTQDPDPKRWKDNDPAMRQRMKALQLAIGYGMSVPSLAKGLNPHPLIASHIIHRYQEHYSTFTAWREASTQAAMLDREISSEFGWKLRLSISPNKRTLYNYPMQSGGAEMLRLAAVRLCEAGIIPCMLIHDGLLIETQNGEQIAQAKEIMRSAGRDVCGGFEIGVDVDQQLERGARYRDKRPMAKKLWRTVMGVLEKLGALLGGRRELRSTAG